MKLAGAGLRLGPKPRASTAVSNWLGFLTFLFVPPCYEMYQPVEVSVKVKHSGSKCMKHLKQCMIDSTKKKSY